MAATGSCSGGGNAKRSESLSDGIATARSFENARLVDAVEPLGVDLPPVGAFQLKPAFVDVGDWGVVALCITGNGSPG
jgi:hypothetical protein